MSLTLMVGVFRRFANWPLYIVGKERPKKEAEHSGLVGGSFNSKRNLHGRLVLGIHKMSRSLHPSTRILNIYTEALNGFSHIHYPDGLSNTLLSQGCTLENGSHCGCIFQVRGGDRETPIAGSSWRVNEESFPLDDPFQNVFVPPLFEEERCSNSPAT